MTYSIVYASDVQKAKRFDAEYFKPEYLEIERKLEEIKHKKVKSIFYPIKNGFDFRDYEQKGETYYIRTADIKENGFQETAVKIHYPDIPKNVALKEKDILFTRKGNYGKNCLVDERIKNSLISSEIMLLRKRENEFNHYYVSIFLRSTFGANQIERNIHGVSNFSITQPALENLKIPLLSQAFQGEIERIVKCAHEAQSQSRHLYKDAETLLLQELGLLGYEPQHRRSFTTTKREVDNAQRCDAEYFQPKYAEIIEKIKGYKGGFDIVQNIVHWKKGIEVGSEQYTDEGKAFIRVSDFSIHGVEQTAKKISEQLFKETQESFQPKKGDILFTKDGTIGICNVLTEDIEGIVSGAFLRLQLKDAYKHFEKECLALILNSIICKLQVEQLSGGAIIAHLKPSDFETLKIPLITPAIQADITEKVSESHRLRKHSKALLHSATRAVELAIEQGENGLINTSHDSKTKTSAQS